MRQDLDALLNALLPFAQDMLRKRGAFFPFGASIKPDGELVLAATWDGDEHPPTQQVIDSLTAAFRAQAANSELRAAAICYDTRIRDALTGESTDAITVNLQHQDGELMNVFCPYRRGMLGRYTFKALTAGPADPTIFPPSA